MKKISLVLCIVFVCGIAKPVSAQTPLTAQNSIFVELLGNGLAYSLNYDRRLSDDFSIRGGFGYLGVSDHGSSATLVTVPILANYLLGIGGASNIEIGAGITYFSAGISSGRKSTDAGAVFVASRIGYKLEPKDGGFMFGIAFTPFLAGPISIPAYGGVELGYTF